VSATQICHAVGFDGLPNPSKKFEGFNDFFDGQNALISDSPDESVLQAVGIKVGGCSSFTQLSVRSEPTRVRKFVQLREKSKPIQRLVGILVVWHVSRSEGATQIVCKDSSFLKADWRNGYRVEIILWLCLKSNVQLIGSKIAERKKNVVASRQSAGPFQEGKLLKSTENDMKCFT